MDKRKILEVLNPIVAADNRGRVYRVQDVLAEHDGDWDAVDNPEVVRLMTTLLQLDYEPARLGV